VGISRSEGKLKKSSWGGENGLVPTSPKMLNREEKKSKGGRLIKEDPLGGHYLGIHFALERWKGLRGDIFS